MIESHRHTVGRREGRYEAAFPVVRHLLSCGHSGSERLCSRDRAEAWYCPTCKGYRRRAVKGAE